MCGGVWFVRVMCSGRTSRTISMCTRAASSGTQASSANEFYQFLVELCYCCCCCCGFYSCEPNRVFATHSSTLLAFTTHTLSTVCLPKVQREYACSLSLSPLYNRSSHVRHAKRVPNATKPSLPSFCVTSIVPLVLRVGELARTRAALTPRLDEFRSA